MRFETTDEIQLSDLAPDLAAAHAGFGELLDNGGERS
jgi:hypothetical protein